MRDSFICQYCGNRFTVDKLTIDHLIPIAFGGTNVMTNLLTACTKCNRKKGSKIIPVAKAIVEKMQEEMVVKVWEIYEQEKIFKHLPQKMIYFY